jgi:hypothetical protein
MNASPRHYAPFCVLGVLLSVGGANGVEWLEKEYDKHVILLYEENGKFTADGVKEGAAGQAGG